MTAEKKKEKGKERQLEGLDPMDPYNV